VEAVRLGTFARGADNTTVGTNLVVSDSGVTATSADTLQTGAQAASWNLAPAVTVPGVAATPQAFLSTDNGATWADPVTPDALPDSFDGLIRWTAPLGQGETFTGITLAEPQPVPVLDPMAEVVMGQDATATVRLTGTWTGAPVVLVSSASGVSVTVAGTTLTVASGLSIGAWTVQVRVSDDTGQTSTPEPLLVTVHPPAWDPPDTPILARQPIVVKDAAGGVAAVVRDPTRAVITDEINGKEEFAFSIPTGHPAATAVVNERRVEVAGREFIIRRRTRKTRGLVEVWCAAPWYDLNLGDVDAQDWAGRQAGPVMASVLQGTGWTVGTVNVSTARTWSMAEGSPMECLRQVAQTHGGDLVFDNSGKTVSLLTFSGRDQGVTFLSGSGLTTTEEVIDSTALVTRIVPVTDEGVGIEAVNGGVPHVQDDAAIDLYGLRQKRYKYKAGTTPQSMLTTALAFLQKRCKPDVSLKFSVVDRSAWSGQTLDRFAAGDIITAVDRDLGVTARQRILALEYDLVQPHKSAITLSGKLRELGSADVVDATVMTTGADIDVKDFVPDNSLLNGRFDNGLAHWAASGGKLVAEGATGPNAIRFASEGWIEQTVAVDNRDVYTFSMVVDQSGFPPGEVLDAEVDFEFTFTDGTTELVTLNLGG
jgi:phage minor structural protein